MACTGGCRASKFCLGGVFAATSYCSERLRGQTRQAVDCQDMARRPVTIHLTGFGPFGGIEHNPTSIVCGILRELVARGEAPHGVAPELLEEFAAANIRLEGLNALEVSASACRGEVQSILERLVGRHSGSDASAELCAVIHLGVSSMCKEVKLECRGFNVADFRIPDVQGWHPSGEPVVPEAAPQLFTALRLPEILGELHDRGVRSAISTDAGRYVCNYIFYSSLHAARPAGIPVLFVHVPSFEAMEQAVQVTAVLCILLAVARQLRGDNGGLSPAAVVTSKPLG